MTGLLILALLVLPFLAVGFTRIMTRVSERFRGHMNGWIIMSVLSGVGLGLVMVAWVWAYVELLDRLAVPRPWLLLPFGLLFVGAVVYVLVLGRRLGRPTTDRTDVSKPEPFMPDRRALAKDLRDQLRYAEQNERRTTEDVHRLEAELSVTEQAADGPAKRLATETLTKRLAWQREDLEYTQRRKLELRARLATIENAEVHTPDIA